MDNKIIQTINNIMQQGEQDLQARIKVLMNPTSHDYEICKSKFINEVSFDLNVICRETGKEMEKYCAKNYTETELTRKVIEKTRHIIEQITYSTSNAFINSYVNEVDAKINAWRFEQKIKLQKELEAMIPDEPYYSPFNAKEKVIITPEEGRRQAAIIANTIANAVYDKLIEIYHETGYLPTGGNLGNYRSVFYPNFFFWKKSKQAQMQCQDWTELLYKAIEPVLELHFKRNVNSFQMNWHTKMPFFGYSSDKAFIPFNFGEHNWIRLIGPHRKSAIMIDPWKSGGRYLIEKNYEDGILYNFFFGRRTSGYHFGDARDNRVKIVPMKTKPKRILKK